MKKTIIFSVISIVFIIGLYILGSRFIKESSAFIGNYSVAEDGSKMTIEVGSESSVGYIREVSVYKQEGNRLYLDCYLAFGRAKGSIGNKRLHTISLKEDISIISLYSGNGLYKDVLEKDENGEWQRIADE